MADPEKYSIKESNYDNQASDNVKINVSTITPKITVNPINNSSQKNDEGNGKDTSNLNFESVDVNNNNNLEIKLKEKRSISKYVDDNLSRVDRSHILKKLSSNGIAPFDGNFDNIGISHNSVVLPDYNFSKKDLDKEVYFFFINPNSGSKEGSLLLNTSLRRIEFSTNKNYLCFMFSLIDNTLNDGIELLREFQMLTKGKESLPRVIIGGGDGTTMSFLESLNSKSINVQLCYYGILPLGTGNDLSNALGFGSNLILKKVG